MLTIFILLAGIKSDCFGLAIGIVLFMWAIILGGTGSKHKKLNDIDKIIIDDRNMSIKYKFKIE